VVIFWMKDLILNQEYYYGLNSEKTGYVLSLDNGNSFFSITNGEFNYVKSFLSIFESISNRIFCFFFENNNRCILKEQQIQRDIPVNFIPK
jgi:hypothetical protein